MLLLQARVDLGAMARNEYSTLPKAPALQEPHHQIIFSDISRTFVGGVLALCRDAVGVFYNPSRLGHGLNKEADILPNKISTEQH